jgi:hypothetical protein
MNALSDLFTAHPVSVGETYTSHLRRALKVSGALMVAGTACFVHALLPFLFEDTASQTVATLHARHLPPPTASGAQGSTSVAPRD